ncbi:MAG: HAD-IIB family hydrolase [Anaerolineaceae bacterium]|nr:HAD-IIB family hydrolase [Anaerolineaceae bacterium]
MSRISLIAVDLDGTLLLSGTKRLAAEGARLLMLAASQGIRVVLSTARTPESTRVLCAEMGLHDPLICNSGADVWGSPDGPVWAAHVIPRAAARVIAEYADACNWELSTTIGEMTYWRQRHGESVGLVAPRRMVLPTNTAAIIGDPVRILAFQDDAIAGLTGLCAANLSDTCRTDIFYSAEGLPNSLGIFPAGADKGSALQLVLERLGISSEETLAIGDNFVDLPMFAAAGFSVAMGNAPPEVRRRAALVAPNNDEEGVAWALKKIILELDPP